MDHELPITGVADRKQLFIQSIKKSVGFVNKGQWKEKNLVGETTFFNGIIYQSIMVRSEMHKSYLDTIYFSA